MEKKIDIIIRNFLLVSVFCLIINFVHSNALSKDETIDIKKKVYASKKIEMRFLEIHEKSFEYNLDKIEIEFRLKDILEKLKPIDMDESLKTIKTNIQNLEKINNELLNLTKKIKELDLNKYNVTLFNEKEIPILEEIFWNLIEEGKAKLVDKKTKIVLNNIFIDYYYYHLDVLYGQKGRIFRLPSGEILKKIVDYKF